jgi:queuosine precursor transporter
VADHTATTRPRHPAPARWTRGRAVALTAAVFATCVAAANALTARYGLIPVGLGLSATAGTFAAGFCLLARDWVHDSAGRAAVLAAIAAGGAASAVTAGPRLAVASATAFVLSELADLAVYQPLRRRGFIRAVIASNTVGAPSTPSGSSPWPASRSGPPSPDNSSPRPPPPRSPWPSSSAPVRYYATAPRATGA